MDGAPPGAERPVPADIRCAGTGRVAGIGLGPPTGRIGPNAVIQLGAAMRALEGETAARRLFARAGHLDLLDHPPAAMIDQRVPIALFATLWRDWPTECARAVAAEAGRLTGDYIAANRIPALARIALRLMPAGAAADLLISAIRRHAWTFAGSGTCETGKLPGKGLNTSTKRLISIRDNPLAMPDSVWHRAVIGRLFTRLVSPRARVDLTACCNAGDPACRFEITLA
ncbi:MAG: bacteriochlorophyll 4-vinyl reductase [Pseudomonadota bacterium]